MNYFLDTDVCIYYLNGEAAVVNGLNGLNPEKVKVPSIVVAELIDGALSTSHAKHSLAVIEKFYSAFEIVHFCQECAVSYGHIRHYLRGKGAMIGPNDLIIAATVLAHQGTLITYNTKEFNRIPNIKIQDFFS